jgi:hypothetical protein
VGFALTTLQRRLASSSEAIYQSLKRRQQRLKRRVEEEKLHQRGATVLAETLAWSVPEDADELTAEEQEQLEEEVVDQATAAQTMQELEAEIRILQGLEAQAQRVVRSGQDRKWDELSQLLQNTPEMLDASGRQRKLIVFSEHRDTLRYLQQQIGGLPGDPAAIVTIHGGVKREDRLKVQELFRNDPATRVLIATDAAGEGINLQNANLMVNYDLPWNPNRLEQRFGRIHRIGQIEVCHLWNMVAVETREGDVFQQRVCFEKQSVRLLDRVGAAMAELMPPGHPLMQALTDIVLEQHRGTLKQGAVLVDPHDMGLTPRVTFLIDHAVKEGRNPELVASRRIQFVAIDPHGNATHAGWAPHLDLEPVTPADLRLVEDVLQAPWITQNLEQVVLAHAATQLVPEHFEEVRTRRERQVDKTLGAVHERLVREINFWSNRYIKFQEDIAAGKDVRLTLDNVRRTIEYLTARRQTREQELMAMRHVISATPVIVGGTLVIPAGLLAQRKGGPGWTADAEARARIERIAMQAVMEAERAQGHAVVDVSAQRCGWDVTSIPPVHEGKLPPSRHIEVKGRAKGQTTITVTRNEILYGLNQADKFILAIVLVDGDRYDGPFYVRHPFTQEPDWAVTSVNLDLHELLSRAEQARG